MLHLVPKLLGVLGKAPPWVWIVLGSMLVLYYVRVKSLEEGDVIGYERCQDEVLTAPVARDTLYREIPLPAVHDTIPSKVEPVLRDQVKDLEALADKLIADKDSLREHIVRLLETQSTWINLVKDSLDCGDIDIFFNPARPHESRWSYTWQPILQERWIRETKTLPAPKVKEQLPFLKGLFVGADVGGIYGGSLIKLTGFTTGLTLQSTDVQLDIQPMNIVVFDDEARLWYELSLRWYIR